MRAATASRVFTLLLMVGLLAVVAAPAHAQFVTYDNFSGGVIDPDKWQGSSTEGPFAGPTGAARRVIENGSLRLAVTSWGSDSSDSGFVTTRQRVLVKQLGSPGGSGFITGLKADVTPLVLDVQDCPTNPVQNTGGTTALRARARLVAWLFNDGSGGAGNQTGDIFALLQLTRDADGANKIRASLLRCSNTSCGVTASTVPDVLFTALWAPNTPLAYEIAWDEANAKVTFSVTNPSTLAVEPHDVVYQGIVTNAGPPIGNFTTLEILNSVKNCSTAHKRVITDALFDNVQVRRRP